MSIVLAAAADLRYTALAATQLSNATVLVVLKRGTDSVGNATLFRLQDSGGFTRGDITATAGTDILVSNSSGPVTMNVKVADGWVMLGITKVAGTTAIRFHKYVYSTGVATHENAATTSADPAAIGVGGNISFSRTGAQSNATFAAAAIYNRVLTDAEFELAAQGIHPMASLNPSWGLWVMDGASTTLPAEELFIGSAYSSGTVASIDSVGPPLGHLYPVMEPPVASAGGEGTSTMTADGVLTASGGGAPSLSPALLTASRTGYGWRFVAVKPSGLEVPFYPAVSTDLTHDWQRDVRRASSGLILLPSEAAKLDLIADKIQIFLDVDGVAHQMGLFNFTESVRQPDVTLSAGVSSDILTVGLSDQFIRLRRATGVPETLFLGADPSIEMQRILQECGVKYSIAGSASVTQQDMTWDGGARAYDKVTELAELAGHRPPWADNYGVIRSIASGVVETDIIPLTSLSPVADTIAITENYLTAPNRVIVTDNSSSEYPIRGQWDAPASAPHSEANRGYVLVEMVTTQGLANADHANEVARTIGENFTARQLSVSILPTWLLDGPVILSYDDALWMVTGWNLNTAPGEVMSVNAVELVTS